MLFKFNSAKAILYAKKYLKEGNPFYKVFDTENEGCNFVSQCILAGCEGFSRDSCHLWQYVNEKEYTKTWIDTECLFSFLLSKNGCGPFGRIANKNNLTAGDIVFFEKKDLQKTVGIVSKIENDTIFYSEHLKDYKQILSLSYTNQ